MTRPSDVAFTEAVKAQQTRRGSRAGYRRMEEKGGWQDRVTPDLVAFLGERDSFYFATASAAGQPYIQHRGGPKGFLKAVDDKTLGFADFAGNKQYISLGNLSENDRAHIFLMDYANRQRVKIWGRARVVEDDPALLARLADPAYRGRPERAILFEITAWDVNCPQHIAPRYSEDLVALATEKLRSRIAELEAEVTRLKGQASSLP
ncbi:pyridoxamine 5'-phosphate oxidase family protein [Pelagibius sp.]|uniref:pyridoxamine 5'-phosphate oxidase family protein n=1 Tax=Pelagibius sp. TaxID=1931238 RepID=UPI002631BD31|nr:pyridoxamine 5'-phosphate oxidase family protein [Pelagibius sp.]